MTKKAYFAGGCFWGLEELIRQQPGVQDTEVGYMGGSTNDPTYEHHPGHAEAVEITYDEAQTSYKQLLDYFFSIHDPTTLNRQGNDVGSSYRSAVFYQSEAERQDAREMIDTIDASGNWNSPVVTALEPFTRFWPAEAYHQDYLERHPDGYTCHYVRSFTS